MFHTSAQKLIAAPLLIFVINISMFAEQWSGNVVKNPGFEEDFVNAVAESHCISFKGDWYYNQKDSVPDYWLLRGNWSRSETDARSGRHTIKLADEKTTASQQYYRAIYQHGGGAWKGGPMGPMKLGEEEKSRFAVPWKAAVWVRGKGSITLGGIKAESPDGTGWMHVTVECPAGAQTDPAKSMKLTLTGPGEFDDVVVQQQIPNSPNLIDNASFEQVDSNGNPEGWSEQRKFRAIGPTYYVWTDWNHAFRPNRGAVTTDKLVVHRGERSLRFDVYPGDEKYIESDLVVLNQTQPRVMEVGVYVRADRIKLLDIRLVNQDGDHLPAKRPREPEWNRGGSFLFGNGTFGWRYVRKTFACLNNERLKGVRVRLCARGFNGHTLDDGGTRPYGMTCGTVWWDDLRVMERASDEATLQQRGVKLPKQSVPGVQRLSDGVIDFGERFFGENTFIYSFTSKTGAGSWQLKLTTTLPGNEPVETTSKKMRSGKGKTVTLTAPYTIKNLAGELLIQAKFDVELFNGNKNVATASYAFNTWPVVVDVDIARHYNLPNENPVSASLNLGVAEATLKKIRKLTLELYRASDQKVLGTQTFNDVWTAFKETKAKLPALAESNGLEFNLPAPITRCDHTNLIITKLDLSKLKVCPHDNPVRDTVLRVRGTDAAGKELFSQESAPFCRMQPAPKQADIKKVEIRKDGALLINNRPRFITGATHQNQRIRHTFPIIDQLDLMGQRLTQGNEGKFKSLQKLWSEHGLYAIQIKPVSGQNGIISVTSLSDEQKKSFEEFVTAGGMKNVVSINSGGWERTIDFHNPDQLQKHKTINDWLRRVSKRPIAISTSGAFNAWWLNDLHIYDIVHGETEMWGPMDFNVVLLPYCRRAGRKVAWVYLPQLYDNHPFERYRFEIYENIIRGSCGVSMIQGIGDPTFNRGIAGELRYLEEPLNSLDKTPEVTFSPNISHKVTRHKNKTTILATNCGPIILGNWKWTDQIKFSGRASHEGDSINTQWFRPDGIRIHGFRGLPMPEMVQKGDKIVQHLWIDPNEKPDWIMVAVRGDGRFAHNAVLGKFDFDQFCNVDGNILMYSELNHSVWHEINWILPPEKYKRLLKVQHLMHGRNVADGIKNSAEDGRQKVRKHIYQANHFHNLGSIPKPGEWYRIEIDAEKADLVGRLIDGFAYLTRNGRALWDYSTLERNGEVVRVFCEDTAGIDRSLLSSVRISVPGLKYGTKIKVLFEDRTIISDGGSFTDDFDGLDTYGYESDGVIGDMFGFIKDPNRELNSMIPSGTGYSYGPTAVHIYEFR